MTLFDQADGVLVEWASSDLHVDGTAKPVQDAGPGSPLTAEGVHECRGFVAALVPAESEEWQGIRARYYRRFWARAVVRVAFFLADRWLGAPARPVRREVEELPRCEPRGLLALLAGCRAAALRSVEAAVRDRAPVARCGAGRVTAVGAL